MFFMMCRRIAVLHWKWCLRKLSETTLTWRQMVMLCVTRIPENWKSIQNAKNFMEKHIIRLSWGEYNSGSLEAIEFNMWTDVFPPLCVIMWTGVNYVALSYTYVHIFFCGVNIVVLWVFGLLSVFPPPSTCCNVCPMKRWQNRTAAADF